MDGLLWLYGPSGVGKTSVGWELFRRLEGPVGYVDADQVGLCYPPSADDPDNHRLKARNVAAVSGTFRRAGARSLIVSGYLNSAEVRDAYAARLPAEPVVWCRLRVDERELRERFGRRGWAPHLVEETVAEAEELDRTDFADLCVDTSGMSVAEVADQVWGRVAGRQGRRAVAGNGAGPGPATGPGPAIGPAGGPVPVLWLCGPPAVGKSSVGYEVFTQVNRSGVRAAYLDLAQVGFCRPAPDEVRISNLAAVWANHLAAGARCLVMTGQVTSDEVVRRYAGALPGAALTVCRLDAGADELVERVMRRGRGEGPQLAGDGLRGQPADVLRRRAEEAVATARALDRARVGDVCVDTGGRSVREVARLVRASAGGWPNGTDHGRRGGG